MIEKIKKKVSESYDINDKRGLFLTWMDNNDNVIFSNWVIYTDKTLSNVIDDLYYGIVEKQKSKASVVIIDVISEINEVNDSKQILEIPVKQKWVYLIEQNWEKSWVMLPNIEGVSDAKSALYNIKQKYQISWNVKVYTFDTKRQVISL